MSLLTDDELIAWVEHLVKDRVPEQTTLDYKSAMPLDTPKARVDLATDLSSFANEAGGEIVVGIATAPDTRGEPEIPSGAPPGVEPILDLVSRTQDIRADLVRPRLLGVEERVLEVSSGKFVYILRVPQSLRGPHMVNGRYYHRTGHRNQPMDEYLVRERYQETLTRETRVTDFLNGADLRSHESDIESRLNLRVALLPELGVMDVVEFTPALLQAIQAQRRGHFLPRITWFGAQDSEDDESWRYYGTGEVVMWAAEGVWPVEGVFPGEANSVPMRAPFARMLVRAAEVLWLRRLLSSYAKRSAGDMRLLLQWRNPTGNPLVPDLSGRQFWSDDPLVIPQENLYIRASSEVREADLGQPTDLLRQLADQLGRYFGRTDLGTVVLESEVEGQQFRAISVVSPRDRLNHRIWPPRRF